MKIIEPYVTAMWKCPKCESSYYWNITPEGAVDKVCRCDKCNTKYIVKETRDKENHIHVEVKEYGKSYPSI